MTIAPHSGIVDFGTFTPPAGGKDGIQGEVPAPLTGQETYVLTATGWATGGGGGTVTQINTGTGLSGGPITSSGTISLANTTVTPASYTNANITVDAQGRITSAANGSAGGVTSFSGGSTGLTPNTATTGSITLAGTLAVSNGGTGVTTSTGTGSVVLSNGPTFGYFGVNSFTSTTPVLSFNASNSPIAIGSAVTNNYLQVVVQNTSATSSASTNYVLSNDLGTDSSYYGEFGMNSSVYSSSTPSDFYSINNSIYFSGHDGDLAIGSGNGFKTYFPWGSSGGSSHVINASGALGFSTNLGTTPALSGTTGFGTAGQVLVTGGSAAAPAWNANLKISSGALTVGVAGTQAGTLLLSGATSGTTTVAVASAASGTLTLPAGTGTVISSVTNMATNPVTGTPSSSNYLRGDGTWAAVPASSLTIGTTATSGGAAGQIMFDTGSVLQESSSLLWDNTNKALTLTSIANPIVPTLTLAGGSGITGTALSGVAITGTGGQFSCNAASLAVGQFVTISGTLGGTGTITGYANPTTYLISATNGSTTFTLVVASSGAAIVTTAGTPTGLTYTVTAPVINISETWNNSNVLFTGLKLNVTDTASNASSLLLDLQVGGVSKITFSAKDYGQVNFGNRSVVADSLVSGTWLRITSSGLDLSSGNILSWTNGNASQTRDITLSRRGAANLRFGAADAAAPVAQTLSVQSVVAGTSNTAGANLTITGSQGTGTGIGGDIIFQVAPAGTTGTAQNALVQGLRIYNNQTVVIGKAYTVATLPTAGTQGRKAWVTDATAPTFLGTLTGGGSVVTPVFDNGTAWVAG